MTAVSEPRATIEHADMRTPASFVWDYRDRRPRLTKLYEKSKTSQWNASTDLDWDVEIDPGAEIDIEGINVAETVRGPLSEFYLSSEENRWLATAHEHAWTVAQFMHGEQGALIACGKIVAASENIDDKYYAAQQVADEARHVEAYQRYLEQIDIEYPVAPYLKSLLDDVIGHRHIDMTYLGMQILVEGVALAAFSLGGALFANPLIKNITELVRRDEARHVAFGVLSLSDFYTDMDAADLAEREEFLIEACALMRDRFVATDVWDRLGLDVAACRDEMLSSGDMQAFRSLMFSKVVPNLRKLGLLTPRVRDEFEKLGILRYEKYIDSATEAGEIEPSDADTSDPFDAMRAAMAGVETIEPSAVMAALPGLVEPAQVREAGDARIHLSVSGTDDGEWLLDTTGDDLGIKPKQASDPADVTISMDLHAWTDLIAGRSTAIESALNGKITLEGDLAKALALEELL